MAATVPYPVRLEGRLEQPSRWLWLVKWLLVIPHVVVLAFLWLTFFVLSVVAFVVLFFGGRYPRGIFDFNLGVLRWTWRVAFYAFAANGTDRYPPFTLADVTGYPARLEVDYPEAQRHWFPLVGWWIAGIPQYCVASIFAGSGGGLTWNARTGSWSGTWVGLIDLLVFFAVVALLFKGAYPRSIFDLVLGLNRWVLRVCAYGALMTREYPPFRLDTGETESGTLRLFETPAQTAPAGAARRWGAGRIVGTILASLGVLVALGAVAAGIAGIVIDQTQRDAAGYVMSHTRTYETSTYALVSRSYRTTSDGQWFLTRDLVGNVRIRIASSVPVFVGVGPAAAVDGYLAGVSREVATHFDAAASDFRVTGAGSPPGRPGAQPFWVARSVGSGAHVLTWKPDAGSWRIVLMNADASRQVAADASVGAEVPHLLSIGIAALGFGGLLLLLSGFGLYAAIRDRT